MCKYHRVEFFDKVRYRNAGHPVVRMFGTDIVAWFAARVELAGASVLEMGAGPGVFTDALDDAGCRVTALDGSMVQLSSNPGERKVAALAEVLPFRNHSFDMVFIGNLLHHVNDPVQVLWEARRVCMKNVLVVEPNAINPAQAMFSFLVPEERKGLKFWKGYLERQGNLAGLDPVETAGFGVFTQNRTPHLAARLLRPLNRQMWFGLFLVSVMTPRRP